MNASGLELMDNSAIYFDWATGETIWRISFLKIDLKRKKMVKITLRTYDKTSLNIF